MNKKKIQLQKHKRIATGLFLLMAILYIAMVYTLKHMPAPWMGYVKAFSEAAMVGALADWFAVTALFKHPMGLPIPHTNLIVNSKNKIGDNLGDFVTDNFLTADNIRPYVEKLDLAALLTTWLNKPANRTIIKGEITSLIRRILSDLNEEDIIRALTTKAKKGLTDINAQRIAAKGLTYALEKNEHNRLLDTLLPKAQVYIQEHQQDIYNAVVDKNPILSLVGGKTVTNQLVQGIQSFLADIANNPNHQLRQELTQRLLALTLEIETAPMWKAKLDDLVNQHITEEAIQGYIEDFWESTKSSLLIQLDDNHSTVSQYISSAIEKIALDLENNTVNRVKINNWVQHTIYKLALKNTKEVGQLIRNTVEHWDGRELSDKLELEVGKDLQYIRINGTLVGGLVGLLIYMLTAYL